MESITPLGFNINSFGCPVIGFQPYMFDRSQTNINWFVSKRNGSNSNNGMSPEAPFRTIAAAISAANGRITWSNSPWASMNIIHVAPGLYAENLTALPYGGAIVGLGNYWDLNGEFGVVIKPTSGAPIDCTSIINCLIHNIAIMSPDTTQVFQADNFNRVVLSDVLIAGLPGASPTTTKGFEVVKDCTGSVLNNVSIWQCRNGVYITTDNANSKQISGTVFRNVRIGGADQTGFYFYQHCTPAMVYVEDCKVGDKSTTLDYGMDDNTSKVTVCDTKFICNNLDPATGSGYYNHCYHLGALIA